MTEREKARERMCRAWITEWNERCGQVDHSPVHWPPNVRFNSMIAHPYLPPRRTLREWLRDAALWLTPPGWVIALGVAASIVALALLFFDMVPR